MSPEWSEGKSEPNLDYDAMIAIDGPALTLEVERSPEKVITEPGRTFSEAALDTLIDELQMFIGSRLVRALDQAQMPKRLTVRVHVRIDGKDAE